MQPARVGAALCVRAVRCCAVCVAHIADLAPGQRGQTADSHRRFRQHAESQVSVPPGAQANEGQSKQVWQSHFEWPGRSPTTLRCDQEFSSSASAPRWPIVCSIRACLRQAEKGPVRRPERRPPWNWSPDHRTTTMDQLPRGRGGRSRFASPAVSNRFIDHGHSSRQNGV